MDILEELKEWRASTEYSPEQKFYGRLIIEIEYLREELKNQEDLNDTYREENEKLQEAIIDIVYHIGQGDGMGAMAIAAPIAQSVIGKENGD